jgi:hypothetical protein
MRFFATLRMTKAKGSLRMTDRGLRMTEKAKCSLRMTGGGFRMTIATVNVIVFNLGRKR